MWLKECGPLSQNGKVRRGIGREISNVHFRRLSDYVSSKWRYPSELKMWWRWKGEVRAGHIKLGIISIEIFKARIPNK